MATAATSLALHFQNPNPKFLHLLTSPAATVGGHRHRRRRRANCVRQHAPPPAAAATDELEGKGMCTKIATTLLSEGQKLNHSLSKQMVFTSTSATATSTAAYPVPLSSPNHHPYSHYFKIKHDHTCKCTKGPHIPRRSLLILPASSLFLCTSSFAEDDTITSSTSTVDTTITDRIFMDFSVCPSYFRSDRPLGAELATCPDSEPLGRVVFGLYGRLLPLTTANFKTTCTTAAYRGTLVHKLLQGHFFVAGHQGPRRDKGEVQPPPGLVRNAETVDPKAFELRHVRPGTLSLCLEQNDDDDGIKLNPDYHNVEFLVTTGPGPCPELDGQNIVFGIVMEGMDVITSIASIPTYKPAERIRLFNKFAGLIGDERAQTARAMWDRPLRTVYISNCGELKVTKPSLSPPSLP